MNKADLKTFLLQELQKRNKGKRGELELIQIEGDELKTLWKVDFPIGDTKVKIHSPNRESFTAYALTRCTDLDFFLHKTQFRFFWNSAILSNGEETNVRNSAIIYEDAFCTVLDAQNVLLLDGWKGRNTGDWYKIFDQLLNFIKQSPSDIQGKVLPNFSKIINQ